MSEPLVVVRDLVKHFPVPRRRMGRRGTAPARREVVHAVDGVSFDVRRGETLGLVGESGCGKTTTARLLLRLAEPSSGSVAFEGEDLMAARGARLKQLRREMQMVFQDPYASLNPRKTAGAIVAEPFAIHGLLPDARERRQAVQGLFERVGLDPAHLDRYPHEFSGGQRQRIGIARAIALEPKLLVADEPVSALDVSIQAQILELLRELQRDLGLTLVLITHDLAVVRQTCDRVAVMYLGKLVELAAVDELVTSPRHPYTRALLDAVPIPDPARERRGVPLGGDVPSPLRPPAACRFHTRCPKAQERCRAEAPGLVEQDGGGVAACHFPLADGERLASGS